MPQPDSISLWDRIGGAGRVEDGQHRIALSALTAASPLNTDPETLRGRSVLVLARRQLPVVLAVIALDGVARRIVLPPPDLGPDHLAAAMADAEVDAVVTDGTRVVPGAGFTVGCGSRLVAGGGLGRVGRDVATEWALFTSGTSGQPKLAVRSLASLVAPIVAAPTSASRDAAPVWGTFYDIRRYGGLQMLLRSLLGGGSMVLSDGREPGPKAGDEPGDEPVAAFLARAGAAGVTHLSGTPSHWRRALMSGAAGQVAPGYVRLSGEASDQAILDRLRAQYPGARVAHAFASTEAGVAFDVRDGLAGFPASMLGDGWPVSMHVHDGTLRVRSPAVATRYLGDGMPPIADVAGFVDTGDIVERRGDRLYFGGRRGGVINVGGLKVHPEAVEAVINRHPGVYACRVISRPSPITGAIVLAEIVPQGSPPGADGFDTLKTEILALCRSRLSPHQVPAMMRQVAALDMSAAGKLVRPHA